MAFLRGPSQKKFDQNGRRKDVVGCRFLRVLHCSSASLRPPPYREESVQDNSLRITGGSLRRFYFYFANNRLLGPSSFFFSFFSRFFFLLI